MKLQAQALAVLASVILPLGSPSMAFAQGSGDCLPPRGWEGAWVGRLASVVEEQPIPKEALYVSSDGHLCSPLTLPKAPVQSAAEKVPGPGRAFLLSALLPGLGQRFLGLDRWAVYMAGEAWAWIQYLERHKEGRRLRSRYRDLAWLVARRVSSGPRVDAGFEYYEALTKYNSSGAFDADPGQPGVQPELDPDTYNGSIWALTRQIFSLDDPDLPPEGDPELFARALRYYTGRAYTQDLAWSWSNNALQQAEYAELIRSSDENLRRSTTMIGVILANHLLSAVDALVFARLGEEQGPEPILSLSLVPHPFAGEALSLAVSLPLY